MARVTVEDCLEHIDNRFELVLVAARRARQIARGAQPHVDWANDKPTVVALREIADRFVTAEILHAGELSQAEVDREEDSFAASTDSR